MATVDVNGLKKNIIKYMFRWLICYIIGCVRLMGQTQLKTEALCKVL